MGIGVGIFLIAVGAILTFAVEEEISGIDISTVGVILMVVGTIGLLMALFVIDSWRGRGGSGTVVREERVVRDDRLL